MGKFDIFVKNFGLFGKGARQNCKSIYYVNKMLLLIIVVIK